MSRQAKPYKLPYNPLRLKQRLLDAGIAQGKLREKMKEFGYICSRPAINLAINRSYLPAKNPEGFKMAVEKALKNMGVATTGIWDAEAEERRPRKKATPRPTHTYYQDKPAGGQAENEEVTQMNYTKEYLDPQHLMHFGLEDDPFFDLDDHSEIWMSPQLKVAECHIYRTINGRGIIAVTGDYGMGKSTFLRHVVGKLQKDPKVIIVMPDRLDRKLMTGGMFTNAIIRNLGGKAMPKSAEDRDALAKKLLESHMRSGVRSVLLLDEGHDLKEEIFIALKRLWDSGAIFKLIAVVLVGTGGIDENGNVFGLRGMIEHNPYVREFAERCYMMDLGRLNGNMVDYLDYRFKRVGRPVREVFSQDALALLTQKARTPQLANNIAIRAMQNAYADGKTRVEFDHVNDV